MSHPRGECELPLPSLSSAPCSPALVDWVQGGLNKYADNASLPPHSSPPGTGLSLSPPSPGSWALYSQSSKPSTGYVCETTTRR